MKSRRLVIVSDVLMTFEPCNLQHISSKKPHFPSSKNDRGTYTKQLPNMGLGHMAPTKHLVLDELADH